MFTFQLAEINKLGDNDETYGQRWWGKANDDLQAISFYTKGLEVKPGDTLTAEVKEFKKTKKDTPYWLYKKVKIVKTVDIPTFDETPEEEPVRVSHVKPVTNEELMGQIIGLHEKLDKLIGPDYD